VTLAVRKTVADHHHVPSSARLPCQRLERPIGCWTVRVRASLVAVRLILHSFRGIKLGTLVKYIAPPLFLRRYGRNLINEKGRTPGASYASPISTSFRPLCAKGTSPPG